ncbi:hypothetical protein AB9F46_35710, partial [Rhizobium leguminosarum]
WLVPILRERGLDGVTAGAIVSLSLMVQAASCLIVPHIAVRGRDQRLINASLCGVAVIALADALQHRPQPDRRKRREEQAEQG